MGADRNYAVLIDADNISDKYIKIILDEISNDGIATYKRIYGDWTKPEMGSWKSVLLEHSITPIQQYGYTTGKNATDSAMIIDAMDILYSGKVEGFCLVSSDSDFTRLASRLRESGMDVVGMGEKKTPKAFVAACNRFRYLDVLAKAEQETKREAAEKKRQAAAAKKQEETAAKAKSKTVESKSKGKAGKADDKPDDKPEDKNEEKNDEKEAEKTAKSGRSTAKSKAPAKPRRGVFYSDEELHDLTEDFSMSEDAVIIEDASVTEDLRLMEDAAGLEETDDKAEMTTLDTIRQSVLTIVRENSDDDGYVFIGDIGNRLNKRYSDFDVRNYGFKKLTPFIQSLGVFEIKGVKPEGTNNKLVYVKEK